jgi:hypothetical protein
MPLARPGRERRAASGGVDVLFLHLSPFSLPLDLPLSARLTSAWRLLAAERRESLAVTRLLCAAALQTTAVRLGYGPPTVETFERLR